MSLLWVPWSEFTTHHSIIIGLLWSCGESIMSLLRMGTLWLNREMLDDFLMNK